MQDFLFEVAPGAKPPAKAYPQDAGWDLAAFLPQSPEIPAMIEIKTGQIKTVSTGVRVNILPGFFGLVLPRSSASQMGLHVFTGVIDAGYTGEIRITAQNLAPDSIFCLRDGMRIAQLVILPLAQVNLIAGDVSAAKTERGANGFGSSGK